MHYFLVELFLIAHLLLKPAQNTSDSIDTSSCIKSRGNFLNFLNFINRDTTLHSEVVNWEPNEFTISLESPRFNNMEFCFCSHLKEITGLDNNVPLLL